MDISNVKPFDNSKDPRHTPQRPSGEHDRQVGESTSADAQPPSQLPDSGGDTSLAIGQVDAAINTVSSLRGSLGAAQSRLGSTVRNLSVQVENITAANSRIRDVDVAFETARLTRNSIMQQAAIAILAQANAQPQAALSLLG